MQFLANVGRTVASVDAPTHQGGGEPLIALQAFLTQTVQQFGNPLPGVTLGEQFALELGSAMLPLGQQTQGEVSSLGALPLPFLHRD